jgi:4-hydroxy-4-methyl-2-oxoglutarate aldolase
VIADGSAVVFLPGAHVEAVLSAAERIAARERLMVQAALQGERASAVMGANYESMLEEKT